MTSVAAVDNAIQCSKCSTTTENPLTFTECSCIVCESCFRNHCTNATIIINTCCACSNGALGFVPISVEEAISFAKGLYCYHKLQPPEYLTASNHFNVCISKNPDNYLAHSYYARCLYDELVAAQSKISEKWELVASASLKTIEVANRIGRHDDAESRWRLSNIFTRFQNPYAALLQINMAVKLSTEGDTPTFVPPEGSMSMIDMQRLAHARFALVPALRYGIGEAVECHTGNGAWKSGMVLDRWYRQDNFPLALTAPYVVRLDGGPKDEFVHANADNNIHIRLLTASIRDTPGRRPVLPVETRLNLRILEDVMLSKARPEDMEWLKDAGRVEWLYHMHARLVAPRRRLLQGSARQQSIKNESIIADELLAYIGTESIEELENKANGVPLDAFAMLKLGDFHMMAIKMTEEQRNSDLGCEYYGKSALNKDPEGMIAYAMIVYLQLVPEEQRSTGRSNDDFLLVIPSNLHDHMNYVHMWDLLEQVALVGYICPFMIVRVEKHTNPLFRIPQTILELYCRHRREYRLLQHKRCNYFDCPHNPSDSSYKLMDCQKCRIRRYCNRDCQVADWELGHKKECKILLKIHGDGKG